MKKSVAPHEKEHRAEKALYGERAYSRRCAEEQALDSKPCDQELGSDYLSFHGANMTKVASAEAINACSSSFVAKSKTIDDKCKNYWNCKTRIGCMWD
jgi:hypothetical protein